MALPPRAHPATRPLKSSIKRTQTQKQPSPLWASSSTITAFPTTKKDKRHIKHSNLISKVTKSSTSSEAQKNKRRRQKKQLVANLGSLADALPGDGRAAPDPAGGETSRGAALREQANVNIIHHKSMKSRPGALKRREKVDKGERERFAKNLAQMNGKKTNGTEEDTAGPESGNPVNNRWAALRGFIAQTMEQKPEMRN
ncbi:hypothetical protein GJ744_006595 [Endocarpon pusillum]|uniref:Ribosome biogenesis protein SLX9 n=1 Tax=Endocarpon pusillum TaxID=364733 RepID=A0A8H7AVY8_9EURO|nr:hypothetical protein GJ744_006595 [Endocarpon pusillum]